MKKTIVIVGTALALGAGVLALDTEPPEEVLAKLPQGSIIIDMPEPDAGSVKSRLLLLTAGGAYERDITVSVTERTAKENIDAVESFAEVVKIKKIKDKDIELEKQNLKQETANDIVLELIK